MYSVGLSISPSVMQPQSCGRLHPLEHITAFCGPRLHLLRASAEGDRKKHAGCVRPQEAGLRRYGRSDAKQFCRA